MKLIFGIFKLNQNHKHFYIKSLELIKLEMPFFIFPMTLKFDAFRFEYESSKLELLMKFLFCDL